ncbi:MAG: hypothetical protein V4532_17605 [Pseudomonadota bacterium]|uniref:hypothetical protein n=1 Tax=Aquabacterium sp. CECT 9606 TaxID=2845822 RepID=UPI001E64BD4D|nr:hypothetical protein [Aquabacterium sp. CECT 9606]CAH0353351.1 hypothetical protein AQB9606_03187 [Aquabacterium sp. CECT 9606]
MSISSQAFAWRMAAALTGMAAAAGMLAPVHAAVPGALPGAPSSPTPDPMDPADPHAAVPTLGYQSPFARVRKLNDAEVGDWRKTNEVVLTRGGWRHYAQEAQKPEPSASSPTSASPSSAPHAGHSEN